uniref:UDP-N-acetylglucosamine diphosphorylase n=1 Tax=viral metagenome TaxID=1070528 RepID=A0A6C0B2Y7_9ZZZZ
MDSLTVTILAAGQGKRMQSNLPKVLHLFKGKPMLVRIIETVRQLKPFKIIVVTGKFHDIIKACLLKYIRIGDLTFVQQPEPKGTGHAILCCLPEYKDNEKVLIVNGDMPLMNVGALRKIAEHDSDVSVLTASFENPTGYGRAIINKRGDLVEIIEEKDCSESEKLINIINTGIYCIHSLYLNEFIPKINNENTQQEYYLTDIIKLLKNRFIQINTIQLDTNENFYVSGVNTREELIELENYAS